MKYFDLFIFIFFHNEFTWTNTWYFCSIFGINSYIRRSGSSITYESRWFCLFIGIGLVCISLFYISLNSYFVTATRFLIYMGAINVLIIFAVMFMNGSEYSNDSYLWTIGDRITLQICISISFFINYYYPRYFMVWNFSDYKIKSDYRTGLNK